MTITTTQKILKVGTSAGVTIPAKSLKELQLQPGDNVKVTFERAQPQDDTMRDYAAFQKQYGKTLTNLADR